MKFLAGLGRGRRALGIRGRATAGPKVGLGLRRRAAIRLSLLSQNLLSLTCRSPVIQTHLGILVHRFTEEYCNIDRRP